MQSILQEKIMSFICRVSLLLVICNFGVSYATEDNILFVRGGKLTIAGESGSGEQKLLFKGKKLRDGDGYSLSFEQKYIIGDKDVVLMMNNSGGTACPVQYFFVSVTSEGNASLSTEFGTCSDLAKPIQNRLKITVSMPKMTGIGSAKYIYENNTIFENGKEIKDVSLPLIEDGDVLINGRGQVLVSGNPNKKVLQCVYDGVEKENKYSDGWDDKIITECNKLIENTDLTPEQQAYTKEHIPDGWRFPTKIELIDEPDRNQSPSLYTIATADFNGDSKPDYAFLLRRTNQNKEALVVKLSSPTKYDWLILNETDGVTDYMGVEIAEPNKYETACGKGYWECAKDEPRVVNLQYFGIFSIAFGKGGSLWYWDNITNKFKEVITSD